MSHHCMPGRLHYKAAVWRELLLEIRRLSKNGKEVGKNSELIESKYLQALSCMRPWDNCLDTDFQGVWARYAKFQADSGRYSMACELANRLAEYSLKSQFDREDPMCGIEAFHCFSGLGLYEQAIKFAAKIRARETAFVEAEVIEAGDDPFIYDVDDKPTHLADLCWNSHSPDSIRFNKPL